MQSEEKVELGRFTGGIKRIADFFKDAAEAVKALPVAEASPWTKAIIASAAEAVAPVKFLVTLLEKRTEIRDVGELAALACSTAYQQSVVEAIASLPQPSAPADLVEQVRLATAVFADADEIDYRTLTLSSVDAHPFIRTADKYLKTYASAAGYSDDDLTRLLAEVHRNFRRTFRSLLVDAALRARLQPLWEMLQLENEDIAAHDFLERHAAYQRSLFDSTPVLKTEPFALKDVYVETECGLMTSRDIKQRVVEHTRGKPFDQFSDAEGGRHDLLTTVMSFIADPRFRDAVVVQGVAGAGKSAFTLRLVAALLDRGLTPIRIRLRDVDMSRPINEALGRAIADHDVNAEPGPPGPKNPLLSGRVFDDAVPFEQATISRYVLILDGWDEISVSAAPGFREQVEKMLTQVRSEYLGRQGGAVRVILTGRPSQEVNASSFFRDDTPVLTVRALTPEQLETLAAKLTARETKQWLPPDREKLAPVLDRYRQEFANRSQDTPTLDILGQPLLAHIAMRLFAVADATDLLADQTTLFRGLVDITCEKGGQPDADDLDPAGRARIVRLELRELLRKTATAITIHGDETIPFAELKRRLDAKGRDLFDAVDKADAKHPLSHMVISFFFKGGHEELGCEFLHKSFREYLHAEDIVETLKEFGRTVRKLPPERPIEEGWKDFEEGDPRRRLSRTLMRMTAAQWMSPEVGRHLDALIGWEIGRATSQIGKKTYGTPTEPIDIAAWEVVRDALADVWDWWGDGVHQRPQPKRAKDGRIEFERSAADEMVEWCASPTATLDELPAPSLITQVDAHAGEVLFRLTARVHYAINEATGWNPPELTAEQVWTPREKPGAGCRRYQARIRDKWVVFAPSGPGFEYFSFYASRIWAAGYGRSRWFPGGLDCRGLDFSEIWFPPIPEWNEVSNWSDCSFAGMYCRGSSFQDDRFVRLHAVDSVFERCDFKFANIERANFASAWLDFADCRGCEATGAILTGASLDGSDWRDATIDDVVADVELPTS